MGVAVKQHIMQVVDWSKYSLEEWLYQFGAWQYSSQGTCGKSINPIAVAMAQSAKKMKQKKLSSLTAKQVVAGYFNDDSEEFGLSINRSTQACCISDNEARAVQRLILDMQGNSDVLDTWLHAIVARYFYNNSWTDMVVTQQNPVGEMVVTYTKMDARFDVKCGLAALHCRYPFIRF